jgi:hypothetical protein
MNLDVILPFHRADRYFESAILSLAENKNISFRTILIDDRRDKSQNLTKLFRNLKKYTIVNTPGGVGYGKSLQYGSKWIESEAVALFNSDDLISPDRLSRQYESLINSEISITNFSRINKRGKHINSILGEIRSLVYDPIFLTLGSYGANATWCARKTWWDRNVYFDSEECLDWRIALMSYGNSQISFINEPLYFYRKHDNQITSNKKISKTKMELVYSAWTNFTTSVGISPSSYSTFANLATPWNNDIDEIDFEDMIRTVAQIYSYANQLDPRISVNLMELTQRRFILSIRKSKTVSTSINLLKLGSTQLGRIAFDLIRNQITSIKV